MADVTVLTTVGEEVIVEALAGLASGVQIKFIDWGEGATTAAKAKYLSLRVISRMTTVTNRSPSQTRKTLGYKRRREKPCQSIPRDIL